MLKKILLVLVLLISLFGCGSKKVAVETVDYLSKLPSIEEGDNYQILGLNDEEIFVAHNKQVCQMVQQWMTVDDGDTVITEPEDAQVCTSCAVTIYAINRDTKEHRVLEQGFNDYYISDFVKIDDQYLYGLMWYDPETGINTEKHYFDNLNASNQIYHSEFPVTDYLKKVFGFVRVDNVNYAVVRENDELYLVTITVDGNISRKMIANNIESQTYSYMYATPYVLIQYTDRTEICSILEEQSYILNPTKLSQIISIIDNKIYGNDEELGVCYVDLLTNETVNLNKKCMGFSNNTILFEDEIWYVEDNRYKKVEFDYEIKGANGFDVYEDEICISSDEGAIVVSIE